MRNRLERWRCYRFAKRSGATSTERPSSRDPMTVSGLSILVTGGAGFLGSRLAAHLLRRGNGVTILVRHSSSLKELEKLGIAHQIDSVRLAPDYSNVPDIINKSKFDVVVHVAAVNNGADGQADTRQLISSNVLFPSLL